MIPSYKLKYHEYLKTKEWQEKRKLAIKHYGGTCALCSKTDNLNVHHKSYENIFNEQVPRDLIVLCQLHHQLYHEQDKTLKQREYEAAQLDDVRILSANYSEVRAEQEKLARIRYYEEHKEEVYNLCMTVWKKRHEQIREQSRRIYISTLESGFYYVADKRQANG